ELPKPRQIPAPEVLSPAYVLDEWRVLVDAAAAARLRRPLEPALLLVLPLRVLRQSCREAAVAGRIAASRAFRATAAASDPISYIQYLIYVGPWRNAYKDTRS